MEKIKTRVAADNVPEELMKRLAGYCEREMISESVAIRFALNDLLPPLEEVKIFYEQALQKQRSRRSKKKVAA